MKFVKPPLLVKDQIDVLLNRGMVGDRTLMAARLESVSYFRLSGYSYPFRQVDSAQPTTVLDDFRPNTRFEDVWDRYVFDRRLRLIVMDAIERIEVAVRTQLANLHGHRHGVFGYATDATSLPFIDPKQRYRFLADMADHFEKSKEPFVAHFKTKYGDCHNCLPVFMACEVMTFGAVLTFHRGCHQDIRQAIAFRFGVHDSVLDSWLLALNTVRNICAHHGRLWNRELGTKPKIPNKAREWHHPVAIENNRVFGILTICRYCLDRIAPQSNWVSRLQTLLTQYPSVPIASMGFPTNWQQSPIWAKTKGAEDGG
jgi:abortive infection bacteriophage resistance protein